MTERRRRVHTAFLFLLPVLVAVFDWPVWGAVVAVLLMLAWYWMIALSGFRWPEKCPPLVLDSISASHFVEKVRWNMDRAGIDYVEKPAGATLGALFLGRTVPRLRIRTGAVRSQIGNSAEILRYLYGACAAMPGERAAHLRSRRDAAPKPWRHANGLSAVRRRLRRSRSGNRRLPRPIRTLADTTG